MIVNEKINFLTPITQSVSGRNKKFMIKGICIRAGTTKNSHRFLPEVLKDAAETMTDLPFLADHKNEISSILGRVRSGSFDETEQAIIYEAEIMDKGVQEKINDGRVTSVSIGAVVKNVDKEEEEDGVVMVPRDVEIVEISAVACPAAEGTSIDKAMLMMGEKLNLKNKEEVKMETAEEKIEAANKLLAEAKAMTSSETKVEEKIVDETKGLVGDPKITEEVSTDTLFIGADKETSFPNTLSMFHTSYQTEAIKKKYPNLYRE